MNLFYYYPMDENYPGSKNSHFRTVLSHIVWILDQGRDWGIKGKRGHNDEIITLLYHRTVTVKMFLF